MERPTEAAAAESYDKCQEKFQAPDSLNLIDRLSIKEGSVVLDLGCGTGYVSSLLAKQVGTTGKVIGVDPKPDRIQIARTKYGSVRNLQFSIGSSDDFPSGPYDLVISLHVFHWIEDKTSAFKNIYKNLKVGGRFAFLCVEEHITKDMIVLTSRFSKDRLFFWTSQQYEALAIECGFEVEFKSTELVIYDFDTLEEYIEWNLATSSIDSGNLNPTEMSDVKNICTEPHFEWKKFAIIMKRIK